MNREQQLSKALAELLCQIDVNDAIYESTKNMSIDAHGKFIASAPNELLDAFQYACAVLSATNSESTTTEGERPCQ